MPEVIAGIDPSTKPGLAILRDGKVIHAAGYSISQKGWSRGRVNRFYRDWLRSSLLEHQVSAFAYELPIFSGKTASAANVDSQFSYFRECAEAVACELNIEMVGVTINQWRAFWLGTGVAPKAPPAPDHIKSGREKDWQTGWKRKWWKQKAISQASKMGIELKSDDAAEAIGIAAWLHAQRNPQMFGKGNDLFDLQPTRTRIEGTLTVTQVLSEAEKVFANFPADTADQ